MNAGRVAPAIVVALGPLVVLAVTGCTPGSAPGPAAAASPPASSAAAAPAATSAAAPASSGAVQDLVVSPAVRTELLTAFAAAKDIPVSDVAGSRPGSVYYGYEPATQTYWAMANYDPASTDPLAVTVAFQDGGSIGLFKKAGNGAWQVSLGGEPSVCAELRFFPQPVLAAWSLPTSPPAPATC